MLLESMNHKNITNFLNRVNLRRRSIKFALCCRAISLENAMTSSRVWLLLSLSCWRRKCRLLNCAPNLSCALPRYFIFNILSSWLASEYRQLKQRLLNYDIVRIANSSPNPNPKKPPFLTQSNRPCILDLAFLVSYFCCG